MWTFQVACPMREEMRKTGFEDQAKADTKTLPKVSPTPKTAPVPISEVRSEISSVDPNRPLSDQQTMAPSKSQEDACGRATRSCLLPLP